MTHELLRIIRGYKMAKEKSLKTVLATVVAKKGSSYRRPGVRMLISENKTLTGAVSGGCVEKEVLRRAQHVIKTGESVLMEYDGRYRLGCEGVIYILIELFNPSEKFLNSLDQAVINRNSFKANVFYDVNQNAQNKGFTQFYFNESESLNVNCTTTQSTEVTHQLFSQKFGPVMRLIIIGAEHDAVQLCSMASLMGWEVWVIASEKDPRTQLNFPGVSKLINTEAVSLETMEIDRNTAIILMTHSFVRDLEYLHSLKNTNSVYLGLLGPSARREKVCNAYIEQYPEADTDFLENIHGPAGLHLGAETPQEIAVSILAEILSVMRKVTPISLKDKKGSIHSDIKW